MDVLVASLLPVPLFCLLYVFCFLPRAITFPEFSLGRKNARYASRNVLVRSGGGWLDVGVAFTAYNLKALLARVQQPEGKAKTGPIHSQNQKQAKVHTQSKRQRGFPRCRLFSCCSNGGRKGNMEGLSPRVTKALSPFLPPQLPPPRLGYNEALCPRGRDTIFLNAPCAHFGVVWCAVGKFCSGDGMAGCS